MTTVDFPKIDLAPDATDLDIRLFNYNNHEWSWEFEDYKGKQTVIWLDGNSSFNFEGFLPTEEILEKIRIFEIGFSLGSEFGKENEQRRIGRFLGLPVI